MAPFDETELIDETELDSGDLIELYKELIRIIEKDIDNLAVTRFGFSPWSLLTSLGAVGLILFGIGKGIFDADPILVGRVYLFIYFTLHLIYFFITAVEIDQPVKPKRVYFPRERFSYGYPLLARSLLLVIGIVIAARVWDWIGTVIIAIVGFVLVAATYVLMWMPLLLNRVTGNNPRYEKASPVIIFILMLGFASLVVSSFIFLPWPTESTATSFAIGGLLALLVALAELYVVIASPNRIAKRLSALRDDIIFRRKSINDALLELRRIREGSTYFEALSAEIDLVNSKTNEKFQTFEAARGLLDSIDNLIINSNADGRSIKELLDQIAPYEHAYEVAKSNVTRLKRDIDSAMSDLVEKSDKIVVASGDLDSPKLFDEYFNEAHRKLDSDLVELGRKETEVQTKLARLKSTPLRKPPMRYVATSEDEKND